MLLIVRIFVPHPLMVGSFNSEVFSMSRLFRFSLLSRLASHSQQMPWLEFTGCLFSAYSSKHIYSSSTHTFLYQAQSLNPLNPP